MGGLILGALVLAALAASSSSSKAKAPAAPAARPAPKVTIGPAVITSEREAAEPTASKSKPAKPAPGPAAKVPGKASSSSSSASASKTSDALLAAQLADKRASAAPARAAQTMTGTPPPGYDAAAARAKAQPTADHIRTRKGKYDRAVLQSFQTAAGLKPDGLFGPQSRAALVYFGAKSVPGALFKGSQSTYAPPGG